MGPASAQDQIKDGSVVASFQTILSVAWSDGRRGNLELGEEGEGPLDEEEVLGHVEELPQQGRLLGPAAGLRRGLGGKREGARVEAPACSGLRGGCPPHVQREGGGPGDDGHGLCQTRRVEPPEIGLQQGCSDPALSWFASEGGSGFSSQRRSTSGSATVVSPWMRATLRRKPLPRVTASQSPWTMHVRSSTPTASRASCP